jgi:hypothetical protein
MRFQDEAGTFLEIKIVGYQFPSTNDERWDANWLIVEGSVMHPRGGWTFSDACLTTFELEQLARWFNDVAQSQPNPHDGYFTEPCIELRYVGLPEPAVEVRLACECAPPWLQSRDERLEGVMLKFPIRLNDPREAASSARMYLTRFPERSREEDSA